MESDEVLAMRLQQEEEAARRLYNEQQCTRDAAYVRSLLGTQPLGLPMTLKKTNRKKQNATAVRTNELTVDTVALPVEGKRRRRGRGHKNKSKKEEGEHLPKKNDHDGIEEDECIQHLMECIAPLLSSPCHKSADEEEYKPVELFEAMRWAFGPEFVHDAVPPARVANCQRLVEVWRIINLQDNENIENARQVVDRKEKVGAVVAAFRAWLDERKESQYSEWELVPIELMEMILMWLPAHEPRHLFTTRLVCRSWHEVTSDGNQPFWRRLFQAHYEQLLSPKHARKLHRQSRHFEKEAKRESHRQHVYELLQLAAGDDDEDECTGCWKRRYYEMLLGIDMSEWEECRVKGATRLLNGPRPGRPRPNYRRTGHSPKQRRREFEREKRRDRCKRSVPPPE